MAYATGISHPTLYRGDKSPQLRNVLGPFDIRHLRFTIAAGRRHAGPGARRAARPAPVERLAHLLDALLARDGLARALAGPGVGPRALAADRQTLAVPQAAVAADVAEPGDALLHLATELPLHDVLVIEQRGELGQLVLGQVAGPLVGIDPRPRAELVGEERPDPVDVAQRDRRA